MIKKLIKHYYIWILALILTTAFCGLVYVSVHQVLRQSANDPQIEIAQDTANLLNSGQKIEAIMPAGKVDPSISLAPFIIVYNDNQQVTASSVSLDNQTPQLPKGVLDFVKNHGEEKLTWQPKNGIRIASVITKYNGGFVLAGRSLKEVELRVDRLSHTVLMVWLAAFLTVSTLTLFYTKLSK